MMIGINPEMGLKIKMKKKIICRKQKNKSANLKKLQNKYNQLVKSPKLL